MKYTLDDYQVKGAEVAAECKLGIAFVLMR